MTVNFILMLSWNIIDPLVWVRTEPNDDYESKGYCEAEGKTYIVFLVLIAIVNASALVLANVEAFRARNVSSEFSEALYVMMTMVSLLQALVIGIPLLILVRENTVASYFVWSGLIFVVTMAIIGLMFVPKIVMVRNRAMDSGSAVGATGSSAQNQNNNQTQPGTEPAPEIVIIASRDALEPGNGTVLVGKF